MPSEREAVTRVRVEGADQAAGDMKKVADAQRDQTSAAKEQAGETGTAGAAAVAAATRDTADATKEAAQATDEYTGSAANLAAILATVHPRLGNLVTVLDNALKVTGDLGAANLNLSSIIDGASGVITKHASAFKLLGAGTAAYLGVSRAVRKWKELKEEAAAATKAVEDYQRAQGQLAGEQEDTRGALASELIKRGRPTQEALDEAVTREQQLRRAGFGAVSVEAAAAGAGTGADLAAFQQLAAAMERGYIEPGEADPMAALQKVVADQGKAAELQQIGGLHGAEKDRRAAEAREQFFNFKYVPKWGKDDLHAFGLNDEILRQIQAEHGLTGDRAAQALAVARRRMGLQETADDPRAGDLTVDLDHGIRQRTPYELPDERGKYQRVDPLVEQIANALFERFRRDGNGPGQGPPTVNVYNPRITANHRGPLHTVRSRRRERDLAGVG